MKAYRKSDNKEITIHPMYLKDEFIGYFEIRPNGAKRFYYPSSITIKEYYGG